MPSGVRLHPHQEGWLAAVAKAQGGRVSEGQVDAKCPVCDRGKFRARIGKDGMLTLCCQSGVCRPRSIEGYDPEWFREVEEVLAASRVPRSAFRGRAPADAAEASESHVTDLPDADRLDRWTHNLVAAMGSGNVDLWGLTQEQAIDLDLAWDWSWDSGKGRLVCPVLDPETDELHTIIYRSLAGVEPKSRVHKGTRGRYLYAPSGIDRSQPVLVVGGEKDVLAAYGQGFRNVVCFTNGDGPPTEPDRARALRGTHVIIAGDVDAQDKGKNQKLATWLLDVAHDVRLADLTRHRDLLPANGDVYDVLTHPRLGSTALNELLDSATAWSPSIAQAHEASEKVQQEADKIRTRREASRLVDAEEANRGAVTLPRYTLETALRDDRPERPPQRIAQFHEVDHNSTIAAKFKTGKTTLGGNLLRSLADGDDFLDRYPVIKPDGRIGLLNYELTDYDMLDWLDDQDIRKVERIALLNLRGEPFSLASERNQQELIQWCRDMEIEVLHLDPHRRAFKGFGSENSNDDVNAFTDVLDTVKKEAGVRDLFLYVHSGRAVGEMGAEHARGATALDDWADNRWILTKDEHDDRFLYMEGRAANGYVPEFRLQYDPGTRRLTAEDGNRRSNGIEKHKTGILTALAAAESEGALVGQLEKRLEVKKNGALTQALRALVSEGLIIQVKQGNALRNFLPEFAPKGV